MFDGVGMVGAWALHEPIEVAWKVLLGLLACVIICGDQRGVGRPTTIFSVLFFPLCGGALVLILSLGPAFALVSVGALWEWHSLDVSDKGPWFRAIRARTPVVDDATSVLVRPEAFAHRRSMWSVW